MRVVLFLSVNLSSLGNHIVNEDDLASASVIGCRKQHTVTRNARDSCGLEVCDNYDLLADELFGSVIVFDARNYNSFIDAVEESELIARVRLSDLLALYDLTYAEVELGEIVHLDLFFLDGLDGVGLAVGLFFDYGVSCSLGFGIESLFLVGLGIGEVEKSDESFLFDSVEEEIEAGALLLIDKKLIYGLEELALNCLELLLIGDLGIYLFGNRVKLGVEIIKRVASVCDIIVERCDRLLFLVVKLIPDLKVASVAELIDLLGRALLKPELCTVESVGKLLVGIGCADLFKHGLQHRNVEVYDRAELYEKSHRHGLKLSAVDNAVVHYRRGVLVCGAVDVFVVHLIKLEILTKDSVVEAEVERLCGLGLGIEPEDYFGLIELKQSFRGHIKTRGRGHFTRNSLDSDELVALEERSLVTKDLLGDDLGVIIRACRCGMILSARLEVYLLVSPTHCPVYLPAELTVEVFKEIEVSLMSATAGELCLGAILGKRSDSCEIGMTLGTEDADGVVVCLFGVVLRTSFLLALGHILGLEGVEYLKDLASLLQRFYNILRVFARTVHLCLITTVKLDAEGLDALEEFLLKVLCIVFVASERVGNIYVGNADIFIVCIADHCLHVCRNLTATVIFIPRDEKARLLALLFKSLDNEKWCCKISEISYMDRTRGAYSRGADVFFLVGIILYYSFSDFF